MKLHPDDLYLIIRNLPEPVVNALKKFHTGLFLGGGFIRAVIAREEISDIDLFVDSTQTATLVETAFYREAQIKVHATENARTIRGFKYPVQIITRWLYTDGYGVIGSFDFTICKVAIWWTGKEWQSEADACFYCDLAAKRLTYTSPQRNEDAGGSMLRVLKYYQRGYRIPLNELAKVMARMLNGVPEVNWDKRATMKQPEWEKQMAAVFTGLLREVDPLFDADHILASAPAPIPTPTNANTGA